MRYELSQEADRDLEDIFDFSLGKYGLNQAVAYVMGFHEVFELLVENPELGRNRSEIALGIRSFPKDAHIIFYRIT